MLADIRNFRFYSKYKQSAGVHENNFLNSLQNIINKDRGCFELANHFFYLNVDNRQPIKDAKDSLELEKKIIELDFPINKDVAATLINKLLELYSITYNEFNDIRVKYIELIVLRWRALPGRFSKVFSEPVIYYKRRKCFDKADYANSLCDIVHVNHKDKTFEMFECKTTMKAFNVDLNTDERLLKEKKNTKKRKTVLRSKRKQNYMSAFYDFIMKKSNVAHSTFAYVTLAPAQDLPSLTIGNISILTRENLSLIAISNA